MVAVARRPVSFLTSHAQSTVSERAACTWPNPALAGEVGGVHGAAGVAEKRFAQAGVESGVQRFAGAGGFRLGPPGRFEHDGIGQKLEPGRRGGIDGAGGEHGDGRRCRVRPLRVPRSSGSVAAVVSTSTADGSDGVDSGSRAAAGGTRLHRIEVRPERRRAVSSRENMASQRARPASPSRMRSAGSAASRASASASAAGSAGGASTPVTPSSTISGTPATRVETTGSRAAIASMMTVGRMSLAPLAATQQASDKDIAGGQPGLDGLLAEHAGEADGVTQGQTFNLAPSVGRATGRRQ